MNRGQARREPKARREPSGPPQDCQEAATRAGPVTKLRLLGDAQHASKIAFVEFESAGSAKQALNCSGVLLGESGWRGACGA